MQAGAERKKKRRSSLSTDLGHANPTYLHGDGAGLGGPLEAREPGHWLPLLSKARHSLATERAPEMGARPGTGAVQPLIGSKLGQLPNLYPANTGALQM